QHTSLEEGTSAAITDDCSPRHSSGCTSGMPSSRSRPTRPQRYGHAWRPPPATGRTRSRRRASVATEPHARGALPGAVHTTPPGCTRVSGGTRRRRVQVRQPHLTDGSGPTVSVDDLHPPELLAPPAVHGRPRGRPLALGDRTEKVRVVVDPHDLALAAEPHGPGDARDLLGDRTVDAAVNDPVRLVQVRSHLDRGHHAIAGDL